MYLSISHIFILIFISITTITYYICEVKRSFKRLDQLLTRDESIEDEQILSDLFKTLNSKTNTEFAIYNSKTGRVLSAISFSLAGFCLFILKEYVGESISFLLVGFFLFLPDIYVCSKKIFSCNFFRKIPPQNWISFSLILGLKYFKFAFYYLSFSIIMMIFLILLQQSLQLDKGLNIDILLSGTVDSFINSTIFYENKPLDVISGNKLSFSGILFTLGVGGTIIFSLVDHYNKQNEMINRDILEIKKYYQNWFQLNKNNLNFDSNRYDEFNSAINSLRNEFDTYIKIKNNIKIYQLAQLLIILIYFMGIFVIIGSDSIIESIFKVFPITSIALIGMIFFLFKYFYNFIPYPTRKTNSSSGKNHTIYEFTSNTQDNYRDIMSEKKTKK